MEREGILSRLFGGRPLVAQYQRGAYHNPPSYRDRVADMNANTPQTAQAVNQMVPQNLYGAPQGGEGIMNQIMAQMGGMRTGDPSNAPIPPPRPANPLVPQAQSANVPLPPPRPASLDQGDGQGILSRLFGGPAYQSNSMPVQMQPQGPMQGSGAPMPQQVNWGDSDNAADFFRADALRRQMYGA